MVNLCNKKRKVFYISLFILFFYPVNFAYYKVAEIESGIIFNRQLVENILEIALLYVMTIVLTHIVSYFVFKHFSYFDIGASCKKAS